MSRVQKLAVIDIGSNSVRLGIFDVENRSYIPLFSEKALCGLGKGFSKKGELNPSAKEAVMMQLHRFVKVIQHVGVDSVKAVATAAMREAVDGKEFAAEIERDTGFKVRILTEKEEAYYSALGVRSGLHSVKGIVADLGGVSLEMIYLDPERIDFINSILAGGLKCQDIDEAGEDLDAYLKKIFKVLEDEPRLQEKGDLYLVGGGFRTIGKAYIDHIKYEPRNVHHFSAPRSEMKDFVKRVIRQHENGYRRDDFEIEYPSISGKRAALLPYYCKALLALLHHCKAETVLFSSYGLKEGIFFETLSEDEQKKDPLFLCCDMLAKSQARFQQVPDYVTWLSDIMSLIPQRYERLLKASATLIDLAWMDHSEARGKISFWRIAYLSLPGASHHERLFIAMTLFVRYTGDFNKFEHKEFLKEFNKEELFVILLFGRALRLASSLSIGDASLLDEVDLLWDEKSKTLSLATRSADHVKIDALYGESVQKRFKSLQKTLVESV